MTAQTILDWLSSHWTAAWPVVSAALVMVLRSRTPEEWVALGERSPRLQGVVRLLRAVGLDPAKAVSALVQIVTARVPDRPVPAITPPSPSKVPHGPVDHRGERGAVRVGTLVAISGVVILVIAGIVGGALLSGCPAPRLPAIEGCTVGATRCRADRPQVCSSTGRWHDVGDLACAASGGACAEGVDSGVAHCALALPSNPFATDGGSDAR